MILSRRCGPGDMHTAAVMLWEVGMKHGLRHEQTRLVPTFEASEISRSLRPAYEIALPAATASV